jgi:hypothetical protein
MILLKNCSIGVISNYHSVNTLVRKDMDVNEQERLSSLDQHAHLPSAEGFLPPK